MAERLDVNDMSTAGASANDMPDVQEKASDPMDKIFEQNRRETMFELRRLQHGDRPVSGTDSKQNLETFFQKRMDASEHAQEKQNIPSNVDNVEEHRPEAVVVEIHGVIEQRRVSNFLASSQFRQRLERIVRGHLGPSRAPRSASPAVPNQNNQSPALSRNDSQSSLSSQSTASSRSSGDEAATTRIPTPPSFSGLEQTPIQDNTQQNLVQSMPPTLQQNAASGPANNHDLQQNAESEPANNHDPATAHMPWLQQTQQQRFQGQLNAWNNVEHVQRENIIADISELVHRQIVTSAVEGQIGATLEVLLQNRVAETGADGRRVQNFIQNLAPSQPIMRNDFSHLGIPMPQDGLLDNLDNISVVSATSVPYQQTNRYLSREMQAMKAQLQEMKNMLKVSFDLQMNIQRAIQQEVAAAINQAMATNASGASSTAATTSHPSMSSQPAIDGHCIICLDNYSDTVLYRCGHMCLCHMCGLELKARGANCPVCRAPIHDVIRAYKSNTN